MRYIIVLLIIAGFQWSVLNVQGQSSTSFNAAEDSYWENPANWSNGIPDASMDAIIYSLVEIGPGNSATCRNLNITGPGAFVWIYGVSTDPTVLTVSGNCEIQNGTGNKLQADGYSTVFIQGSLTNNESVLIGNRGKLTISGPLTNQDLFTVNSGGSLITYSSVVNTGSFSLRRTIVANKWHLISIPVPGVNTFSSFFGDYLQEWQPLTSSWRQITSPGETLQVMKGYALWHSTTTLMYEFLNAPNTGNQSIEIFPGIGYSGYNLVGNPYPSSIDWSLLDDTYGAVYYWKDNAYISWNNGIGSGISLVPPFQGFFIFVPQDQYNPEGSTFEVNNNHRIHPSGITYYKSELKSQTLVLETLSQDYADQVFISFDKNQTEGFDFHSDAYKMLSPATGLSQLYTLASGDLLSIDVRPETDRIQLGFTNDQAGNYNIGIAAASDVEGVILEDTKTGTFHDLSAGIFEFSWNPNTDTENRFILHVNTTGLEDTEHSSNIKVLSSSEKIKILGAEKGEVIIINMHGQMVHKESLSANGEIAIPSYLKTNIYLLTLKYGSTIFTEKIIIKNSDSLNY